MKLVWSRVQTEPLLLHTPWVVREGKRERAYININNNAKKMIWKAYCSKGLNGKSSAPIYHMVMSLPHVHTYYTIHVTFLFFISLSPSLFCRRIHQLHWLYTRSKEEEKRNAKRLVIFVNVLFQHDRTQIPLPLARSLRITFVTHNISERTIFRIWLLI